MDRPDREPSGEALDTTIIELYETALRLQKLRAVMGHVAFASLRPQDRRTLRVAAHTLSQMGRTLEQQAVTMPERGPAPPNDELYDALLGAEHWDKRFIFDPSVDEPRELVIIEDTIISIPDAPGKPGRQVRLEREHILVLNHLLMADRPLNAKFFQDILETPDGEELTIQEVRGVLSGLHLLLGEEVLEWTRNRVMYLRADVYVIDERTQHIAVPYDTSFTTPPGVIEVNGDFFRKPRSDEAEPQDTLTEGGISDPKATFEVGEEPEEMDERGDGWSDAQAIARYAGVTSATVERFIRRHHAKLGREFLAPELRTRWEKTATERLMTEHFSPQFVEWAVASLRAARARYLRQVQEATEQP